MSTSFLVFFGFSPDPLRCLLIVHRSKFPVVNLRQSLALSSGDAQELSHQLAAEKSDVSRLESENAAITNRVIQAEGAERNARERESRTQLSGPSMGWIGLFLFSISFFFCVCVCF
jgi:hypothetical protein